MKRLIIVRGAGDLATGVIHRLHGAGFPVLALETEAPAAIRRQVALSEAMYEGSAVVEELEAVRIYDASEADTVIDAGKIPLLADPEGNCIGLLKPFAVVDAIIAKRNLGTNRNMAPLTIALGPGFEAGVDADYVIETCRGHNLGRILTRGFAQKNTGIPGIIGGYGKERVIHAPAAGILRNVHTIGDYVPAGEIIARIETASGAVDVPTMIGGLLRGLIRDGCPVTPGFKIADVDPRREEYDNCFTISDKARCIAGSVLELVCRQEDCR